jgi:hypothetical protein
MLDRSKLFAFATAVGITVTASYGACAAVINFDDLTTLNSFTFQGIDSTYAGFQWGFGHSDGPGALAMPQGIDPTGTG